MTKRLLHKSVRQPFYSVRMCKAKKNSLDKHFLLCYILVVSRASGSARL